MKKYKEKALEYLDICKLPIGLMVLTASARGYIMPGIEGIATFKFSLFLLGTLLTSSGAAILNNVFERSTDKLMVRTAERPIVTGAISAVYALLGGLLQVVAGTLLLFFMVNPLTSYLAFLAAFIYVVVYTPLKRISWVNTFIGAVAGALPPLGGWAARTGSLSLEAWLIFTLLYIWQMPHFFSIAWLYRDDYRRASLKMLPAIEEEPIWTKRIISIFLGLLILTSLFPVLRGVSGYIYLLTALIAGGIFLYAGAVFYYRTTKRSAIMLKNASLLYLPLILIGTFLDNLFG